LIIATYEATLRPFDGLTFGTARGAVFPGFFAGFFTARGLAGFFAARAATFGFFAVFGVAEVFVELLRALPGFFFVMAMRASVSESTPVMAYRCHGRESL
jgi:hypothetical protein